jgi:ribose/xylose/arabinose/galactoside ABC-type transport system permease subunit
MMIRNLMNIIGLDPFFQDLLKGAIILIAVGLRTMQARES